MPDKNYTAGATALRDGTRHRRVTGLGSARDGLGEWRLQRLTALALIPLGLYFVASVLHLATVPGDIASHAEGVEIREGCGCGENKDHVLLHLEDIERATLLERLPGIVETARVFAGLDATKEPIPVVPTVYYCMGGIPTNLQAEAMSPAGGDVNRRVPGLMAIGEAACVSVHGANRLGTNSLLDLIVFGRAAAEQAVSTLKPGRLVAETPNASEGKIMDRFDGIRFKTEGRTPGQVRRGIQKIMQDNFGVFRTREAMQEGKDKLRSLRPEIAEMSFDGQSLQWNVALVAALEAHNLADQADVIDDFTKRDDANWLKHTVAWRDGPGKVAIDYRPVRLKAWSEDTPSIPPGERII